MRLALPRSFPLLTLSLTLLWCPVAAQENQRMPKPAAAKTDAAADKHPRKRVCRSCARTASYEDLAEMGFSPLSLLGDGGAPPKPFFRFLEAVRRSWRSRRCPNRLAVPTTSLGQGAFQPAAIR
jgi:hypothetical protein